MQSIIVTGNPIEGFQYWGPFDEFTDAISYQFEGEGDWWVAGIMPIPDEEAR